MSTFLESSKRPVVKVFVATTVMLTFISFWRAAAYCLHPKVIVLSLAPLVLMGGCGGSKDAARTSATSTPKKARRRPLASACSATEWALPPD